MSTIMVVDDMAIFREPIAASLRQKGFDTICAGNGNEAIDLLCAQRPDLILLDVAMPVLDGIGFLKVLRKNPETRDIPVILLTAVAEKDYVLRAKELGVQGYLLKSRFSLDELLARVQKHLDEKADTPEAPGSKDPSGPEPVPATAQPPPRRMKPAAAPAVVSTHAIATATPQQAASSRGRQGALSTVERRSTATTRTPQPASAQSTAAAPAAPTPSVPRKRIRVEQITQVKALPVVVSEVLALTGSRGSTADDLCRALAEDVALAGKVLSVANSSMYRGSGGRVRSLEKAVKTIGFNTIRQIAMSIGVLDTLGKEGGAVLDAGALWRHSFATACIARRLSEEAQDVETTQAYVAALLHDMGKLIFAEFLPDQLSEALAQSSTPEAASPSAERTILGTDHATIAAQVLRHWGLPPELYNPIQSHHRPMAASNTPDRRLTEVLQVADGLALAMGWPSACLDYFPPLGSQLVTDLPMLKDLDHDSLKTTVTEDVREAALVMGLFAHLSVGERPEEEVQGEGPQIGYVTDDPQPLDLIYLWLRHTLGMEPTRHRLTDTTQEAAELIVLNASAPSASKVQRVAGLVAAGGGGVVVASTRWRKFLTGVRLDGWQVLDMPVCAQALETAIRALQG